MAAPVLSSISPTSGPPGTEITLTGSGFDAGAEVGCPALVDTTFVSSTELQATVPEDLDGAAGQTVIVSVYVRNEDGLASGVQLFTLRFGYPEARLQAYTTVAEVAAEVPMFERGGRITDSTIERWVRQVAQQINAALLGRGISLDPSDWPDMDPGLGMPQAAALLALANLYGAGYRLAAAVSADFGGSEWPLTKALKDGFDSEMRAIRQGYYDKLFLTSAATAETGTQFQSGDTDSDDDGNADKAFEKGQVF